MLDSELQALIESAYQDRALLSEARYRDAVHEAVALLDSGKIRVATQEAPGSWRTITWVQEAVLLYFAVAQMQCVKVGPFEFYDKLPLKHGLEAAGVRVVPPGTIRYGAFVEAGAVVMPGYINIGARVGSGTMVDTWATVGSCAQIGKDCHLAGGVGIGGVLEPPGAQPVIVEDGCFIGSRCIVVEGMLIESESVIGAGVVLTASTPIVDVTGNEPIEHRRRVPQRSVVIPGMRPKRFPAGDYLVPCALIIGKRTPGTDRKTSLNAALRDFNVPV